MKRLLLTFMLLTPNISLAENGSQPSLQDHVYEAYRCHAFKMRGEVAHLKDNHCELRMAQLPVRFLDDVSWDEFQKLSADKQAELNQRGLSLFKQWELNNRPRFQNAARKAGVGDDLSLSEDQKNVYPITQSMCSYLISCTCTHFRKTQLSKT